MSRHVGRVTVKKTTELAMLVELGSGREVWVPKSVIAETEVEDEGDVGELFVRSWWADKEDL